ncbi:MAG: CBS domain-containing protein, partial [Bacteroidetes bacterium]|nr:CBS domain-containing protein [Bacteroidota bacterium]
MIVNELISDRIPSVKSTDSAGMALDWMNEFKINQIPIVDDGKYVGIVTENDIMECRDLDVPIGEIRYSGWDSAYIYQGNHVYDAIEMLSNLNLEILPVLDEENGFLGVITLHDLSSYLGRLFAIHEPGGILVLEIPRHSYVLSEIGRIAESADAKVLSLYLAPVKETNDLLLTLKLNLEDLTRVVASFERFDYKVIRTYHKISRMDDYQE